MEKHEEAEDFTTRPSLSFLLPCAVSFLGVGESNQNLELELSVWMDKNW